MSSDKKKDSDFLYLSSPNNDFAFMASLTHEMYKNVFSLREESRLLLSDKKNDRFKMNPATRSRIERINQISESMKIVLDSASYLQSSKEFFLRKIHLSSFSYELQNMAKEMARTSTSPQKLSFQDNLSSRDIMINADLQKLQLAFNCILANAFKFSPNSSTISISLEGIETGQEGVEVTVKNAINSTIPTEVENWIKPGWTGRRHQGSGYGLTIADSIIKEHSSDLSISYHEGCIYVVVIFPFS